MTSEDKARKLLRNLENGDISPDNAYLQLTKHETDTLRLLNRIVEKTDRTDQTILTSTPFELVLQCVGTWGAILNDFADPGGFTWPGIIRILWTGERKIFVGVLLVMIALAMYFVDCTA